MRKPAAPGCHDPQMPSAGSLPSARSRPSPAVRRHPEKLARRPRGEAAAGAWGVAAPGELRGCAGCEPGARVTDVAWAGAARALAKRGACFGALSVRLPEVPSATPPSGRVAALGRKRPGWGCRVPGTGIIFWTGRGGGGAQRKGVERETRSPKPGI